MATLLLHTGGTIAMDQTDQGLAPKAGLLESHIEKLQAKGQIGKELDILSLEPAIDSSEANIQEWNRLITTLSGHMDQYDHFIITHGTDSLSYSAAALSFALRGLQKPVILTASMIPLSQPDNDAIDNLITAYQACQQASAGVSVAFHGTLWHGASLQKIDSAKINAFQALPTHMPACHQAPCFSADLYRAHAVAILTLSPGFDHKLYQYAAEHCDALILRCYGSGTAPNDPKLANALSSAAERQIPVMAVSQCLQGGINWDIYQSGGLLRDNKVLNGKSISAEAAYVKLHYALTHLNITETRTEFLSRDICGEMGSLI